MDIQAVTRSFNTIYQPSGNRDTFVNYCIDIACTLSLSGGETGTIFLEISDQWDFGSNIIEVARTVNGNIGSLTLGLNITQNSTASLCGMVPAASYARIRTSNTTGTPTFTWRSGQEAII